MGSLHRFTEARAPVAPTAKDLVSLALSGTPYIGNTLYTPAEWALACQHASFDGYLGEVEAMLERDDAFVPSDNYAEQDDSAFWAYFGDLHGDPAPDLTAHRTSTVGMS